MPKETFYNFGRVEGDKLPPDLVVKWGDSVPSIKGNMLLDSRSGINRLIKTLRKARNKTFAKDE